MKRMKNSGIFRVICIILVISFVTLDISWAYPVDAGTGNHTLATWSAFQQKAMTDDVNLQVAVHSIAMCLLGDPARNIAPLPLKYLESTLDSEIDRALEGVDLSRVVVGEDGVILVPYNKGRERRIIQIALRDNPASKNMVGELCAVSNRYVAKSVSEGYQTRAASPAITEPEQKTAVKPSVIPSEIISAEDYLLFMHLLMGIDRIYEATSSERRNTEYGIRDTESRASSSGDPRSSAAECLRAIYYNQGLRYKDDISAEELRRENIEGNEGIKTLEAFGILVSDAGSGTHSLDSKIRDLKKLYLDMILGIPELRQSYEDLSEAERKTVNARIAAIIKVASPEYQRTLSDIDLDIVQLEKAIKKTEDDKKSGRQINNIVDLRNSPDLKDRRVVVVSDIHGQIGNLQYILDDGIEEGLAKGEIVLAINGDSVHIAPQAIPGYNDMSKDEKAEKEAPMGSSIAVMQKIFGLMAAYPKSVYYLIGNHDNKHYFGTAKMISQNQALIASLASLNQEYLKKYIDFLDRCPLLFISDDFVACHGGPIRGKALAQLLLEPITKIDPDKGRGLEVVKDEIGKLDMLLQQLKSLRRDLVRREDLHGQGKDVPEKLNKDIAGLKEKIEQNYAAVRNILHIGGLNELSDSRKAADLEGIVEEALNNRIESLLMATKALDVDILDLLKSKKLSLRHIDPPKGEKRDEIAYQFNGNMHRSYVPGKLIYTAKDVKYFLTAIGMPGVTFIVGHDHDFERADEDPVRKIPDSHGYWARPFGEELTNHYIVFSGGNITGYGVFENNDMHFIKVPTPGACLKTLYEKGECRDKPVTAEDLVKIENYSDANAVQAGLDALYKLGVVDKDKTSQQYSLGSRIKTLSQRVIEEILYIPALNNAQLSKDVYSLSRAAIANLIVKRPLNKYKKPGQLIEIKEPERVIVIGDLHADPYALNNVMRDLKSSGELEELKEGKIQIVLLGDYIQTLNEVDFVSIHNELNYQAGRDYKSYKEGWEKRAYGLLLRIAELKTEYPDSFHILAGNSELGIMVKSGSPREYLKADKESGALDAVKSLIDSMPLYAMVEKDGKRYLLSHGGFTDPGKPLSVASLINFERRGVDSLNEPKEGASRITGFDEDMMRQVSYAINGIEIGENGKLDIEASRKHSEQLVKELGSRKDEDARPVFDYQIFGHVHLFGVKKGSEVHALGCEILEDGVAKAVAHGKFYVINSIDIDGRPTVLEIPKDFEARASVSGKQNLFQMTLADSGRLARVDGIIADFDGVDKDHNEEAVSEEIIEAKRALSDRGVRNITVTGESTERFDRKYGGLGRAGRQSGKTPYAALSCTGAIGHFVNRDGTIEEIPGFETADLGGSEKVSDIIRLAEDALREGIKNTEIGEEDISQIKIEAASSGSQVTIQLKDIPQAREKRFEVARLLRLKINELKERSDLPHNVEVTASANAVDVIAVSKGAAAIQMIRLLGLRHVILMGDSIGTEENPGNDRSLLTLTQDDLRKAGVDRDVDLIRIYVGREEDAELPEGAITAAPAFEKETGAALVVYDAIIAAKDRSENRTNPLTAIKDPAVRNFVEKSLAFSYKGTWRAGRIVQALQNNAANPESAIRKAYGLWSGMGMKKSYKEYKIKGKPEFIFDKIKDYLPEEGVVVDVGCGNNALAAKIVEERGVEAIGTDIRQSSDLVKGAEFVIQGSEEYKRLLTDGKADAVILSGMLHYVKPDEMNDFIDEIKRILKPEGKIIILEDSYSTNLSVDNDNAGLTASFNALEPEQKQSAMALIEFIGSSIPDGKADLTGRYNFKTLEEWQYLLEGSGFVGIETRYLGFPMGRVHLNPQGLIIAAQPEPAPNRESTTGLNEERKTRDEGRPNDGRRNMEYGIWNTESRASSSGAVYASELFKIVESSVNNNRARTVNAGNKVVGVLNTINEASSRAGMFPKIDRKETTAAIKSQLEHILEVSKDIVLPQAIEESVTDIGKGMDQFEADGMVAAIIALARRARYEKKTLVIGIETDWIPGIKETGYGTQHDAINLLMREIASIGETLRSLGLDNVEIVPEDSENLVGAVLEKVRVTKSDLRNVVILASQGTVDFFDRSLGDISERERPFLAAVNPAELNKWYDDEDNRTSGKQLDIKIMEMLTIALELACGKEKPALPIIDKYKPEKRLVIFLPKATPIEYEKLRDAYNARRAALVAA